MRKGIPSPTTSPLRHFKPTLIASILVVKFCSSRHSLKLDKTVLPPFKIFGAFYMKAFAIEDKLNKHANMCIVSHDSEKLFYCFNKNNISVTELINATLNITPKKNCL